jgi:twitching motility two-component system response regulator PilG
MYGNLQEIDIGTILQLIEVGQKSGVLLVEASSGQKEEENLYAIFCCWGKIIYAADNSSFNLVRLADYLRFYKLENSLDKLSYELMGSSNIPEYEAILLLGQKQILAPDRTREILQNLVEETIFNLFSLSQGNFIWQQNFNLQPQIIGLKIIPLVQKINHQLQLWKQYYPYIHFASQCPLIEDRAKLSAALTKDAYSSLSRWMDGKTSLRQLARYLNRDIVTIARAIYPYLEMGWVKLLITFKEVSPQKKKVAQSLDVVCVTEDLIWGSKLGGLIKAKGYQLSLLSESSKALRIVFETIPSLIFWDIGISFPDGYNFCRMLRILPEFNHTAVIIVTNQPLFLESLQNKMAGATEYLTKSMITKDLSLLIKKYLINR